MAPQPTVTNPNTGGSFAQQSVVPVGWIIPQAVASGSFRVFAYSASGTYYSLTSQPVVSGQTSYLYNWTVAQPVGTGYKILVYYADAAGNLLYFDFSDQPFAIQ